MKSIHIRELPDETLCALKLRAKRHHRSLQKEIVKLLEDAAMMTPQSGDTPLPRTLNLHFTTTHQQSTFSREDIYEDER